MKRVLHVTTGLGVGGAEMMLVRLLKRAGDQTSGLQHAVISLTGEGPLASEVRGMGIDVDAVDLRRLSTSLRSLRTLVEFARSYRPQVIHGWLYHGSVVATVLSHIVHPRPTVVWGIHSMLDGRADFAHSTHASFELARRLSNTPAAIVYCAHRARAQHEAEGFSAAHSFVVHNGFDTAQFAADPVVRETVRAELQVTTATQLVGCFARYHPMKDHENLLRAARIVSRTCPQVTWMLVGAGMTERNAPLMRMIATFGLRDRVRLLGERPDVARLMAAQDVSVLPSYTEAFPLVVGESMACAVPCVVTDVGDNALLIGESGRCVPSRDHGALAAALLELLQLEPSTRHQMGLRGRDRIQKCFSIDRAVEAYLSIYNHASTEARSRLDRSTVAACP